MTKGRKTTYKERIEIVSFCIENQKDYQLTVDTYHVSYQQSYSWVKKWETQGAEALTDKRGRTKPKTEMTELEKLHYYDAYLAMIGQFIVKEAPEIAKLSSFQKLEKEEEFSVLFGGYLDQAIRVYPPLPVEVV